MTRLMEFFKENLTRFTEFPSAEKSLKVLNRKPTMRQITVILIKSIDSYREDIKTRNHS